MTRNAMCIGFFPSFVAFFGDIFVGTFPVIQIFALPGDAESLHLHTKSSLPPRDVRESRIFQV